MQMDKSIQKAWTQNNTTVKQNIKIIQTIFKVKGGKEKW